MFTLKLEAPLKITKFYIYIINNFLKIPNTHQISQSIKIYKFYTCHLNSHTLKDFLI
jgi:hypothetical protein